MINLLHIIDSLMFSGLDMSFIIDPHNKWLQLGFAFLIEWAYLSMW